VKVIDASSGEEIEVSSLYWSVPSVDGILATAIYSPSPTRGRDEFPSGHLPCRSLCRPRRVLDPARRRGEGLCPRSGIERLEFLVYRQIGLYFTFTDGDASVPWNWIGD
jgi:hypothetical protein